MHFTAAVLLLDEHEFTLSCVCIEDEVTSEFWYLLLNEDFISYWIQITFYSLTQKILFEMDPHFASLCALCLCAGSRVCVCAHLHSCVLVC